MTESSGEVRGGEQEREARTFIDTVKDYQAQIKIDFPDIADNATIWILMVNRGNTARKSTGAEINAVRDFDFRSVKDGKLPDDVLNAVDSWGHDGGLYIISTNEEAPTEEDINSYIDENFS